jgi:hypothetical protein
MWHDFGQLFIATVLKLLSSSTLLAESIEALASPLTQEKLLSQIRNGRWLGKRFQQAICFVVFAL